MADTVRAAAPRWLTRLPLLILGLTLAVLFHRLLLGEAFYWGLPSLQFYPWREYAFDLLRQGQLPLWNPYNGAGAPLLANYQSALLYPLNWFGLLLPLAWWMSVTAVLHLFIAGWGMWAFTGRLGVPLLGRGLSTLAFALTAYLVARLGTYPTVTAAAWLPWTLWAALGLLGQGAPRDVGWLGLLTGLQLLAGHAQTTWYSLLLTGAFAAWWTFTHRPIAWRRFALIVAGMMLGGVIAAAQLLPTAELLRASQRSGGVDFDFAMNFSYAPARTFNLLMPDFFGTPGDGSYLTKEKGAYFEDAIYVGLIPLISAVAGVAAWVYRLVRRREQPDYSSTVPFWLLVVVIGFVFALGRFSPVFPFLYENVPTFSLFQAPVRWHLWTVAGLAVLAGIGAGAWGKGHWLLFSTRLATAAGAGAVVLALLAPQFLPLEGEAATNAAILIRAFVIAGIVAAVAGVLTLTQPEDRGSRWYPVWMLAVWLVVAVDLALPSRGLNPTSEADLLDRNTGVQVTGRAWWSEETLETVQFERYLKLYDYPALEVQLPDYRSSGMPNLNLIDRVPLLNNFDPLLTGGYDQLTTWLNSGEVNRDVLLNLAGVEAVYNANGEREALTEPGSRVYLRSSACADFTGDLDPVVAELTTQWNPAGQVLIAGDAADCDPAVEVVQTVGEASIISETANQVEVQVSAPNGGWLVLADADYPGWAVTVNGQPETIYRANIAFRGVEVLAGESVVVFRYEPGWVWPGLLASAIGLLGVLILFRWRGEVVQSERVKK
jgi:hypothetical protein